MKRDQRKKLRKKRKLFNEERKEVKNKNNQDDISSEFIKEKNNFEKQTSSNNDGYKKNHYIPIWYQKRFLPSDQINQELYYLNLKPENFTDPRGVIHEKKSINKQGFKFCFCEDDLYTVNIGLTESKEIERYFFGRIDYKGRQAVNHFTDYDHRIMGHKYFSDLMMFISTQKLRTPKGLDWLSENIRSKNKHSTLSAMIRFRQLYCAIWTECIWLIADASKSNTKFIVSDHPVTVYNRVCGPRSKWCRDSEDPDIWLNGTHTLFPLSMNKILILTNLSWVRNPYQSATSLRPNPEPLRSTIFKFHDIQVLRHLSEQEVCEINYIIKRRAYKYIGAAKKEWLYPEKKVNSTDWSSYGHGYLLMPDPRAINTGGQIYIGHNDGTSSAYDEYGRPGWDPDFAKESNRHEETNTLYKFKGEFSRLFGPYRRGRAFNVTNLDHEKDDDEFHKYHLSLEKKFKYKNKK